MNNIVTRGFGSDSTIVTRGFGGVIAAAKEVAKDIIRKTGSAAKDAQESLQRAYVVVRASLKEVNGEQIKGRKGVDSGFLETSSFTVTSKLLFSNVYKSIKEIFIRATTASSKRHRRD